ncbi:cytochrome P450 [Pilatotrama ljubarskyi]|nr:cytochrome P450 [Pilatotrama ljubarskyi]
MAPTHWLLLLTSVALLLWRRKGRGKGLRLPLGPQGLPLIGNVLDFPTSHYGASFSKLREAYGGHVVHLKLFGQSVIVLNSYRAAVDLLEKRSANYSDRPRSVMAELVGYDDWVLVLMQYGQKWRQHRRAIFQLFHLDAIQELKPTLEMFAYNLLSDLDRTPAHFSEHIGFAVAKAAMRTVYGIQVTDPGDPCFHMAETIVYVGSAMSTPGAFRVDTFPILRYLPSWFPGVGFKRLAAVWRARTLSYRDQLFLAGKAALDRGVVNSLLGRVMGAVDAVDGSASPGFNDTEEMCRGAAATAYAGGADTTHTAIHLFFLIMATHKEAQAKAQAELDSVIGSDRLPTFSDRTSLPFMNALIKEVLRWHVISPIGVAHRSVADDEYDGYLIPAGSIMIPNIWAMARDESVYPDPELFSPERFLIHGKIDPNVRDPASFAFGFGRRICPGLDFADAYLYIVFASVLHVFSIGPPLDEKGAPQPLAMKFVETSLTARPEPFRCTIQPRSVQAAQLVRGLSVETSLPFTSNGGARRTAATS